MNLERLSEKARTALSAARDYAKKRRHARVEPEHLLLALVVDTHGAVGAILEQLGADARLIEHRLDAELRLPTRVAPRAEPASAPELTAVLEAADREAKRQRADKVKTDHLLMAIADGPPSDALRILKGVGVSREAIRSLLRQVHTPATMVDSGSSAPSKSPTSRSSGPQRSRSDKRPRVRSSAPLKLELLNQFGIDLTEAARKGEMDPVIGRDHEIRRLLQVLTRRTKNNPML